MLPYFDEKVKQIEHGKVGDYVGEFKDQVVSVDQKILALQNNVNHLLKK